MYHYDGQELNHSMARVLFSSFSSYPKEKKDIEREREMLPLALPTVIKKRSSFVVHNWRAYKYIPAAAYLLD